MDTTGQPIMIGNGIGSSCLAASDGRLPMAWRGFSGWRNSLFGDTHTYGEEGVRLDTRQKAIIERWSQEISKGAEFAMPVSK
ncbi:hypothetical protein [Hyphomicrobium sp.]|uniref:hypothetical protein n=1 Tax=Hyphomicrobium sp. TaxID=82 RepID=UPI001E0062E9|nr:hypothetical protein [Hyphomicrobium sp.]MBY0558785.1 hypothetical protein [Hyphomicrobium sp.]